MAISPNPVASRSLLESAEEHHRKVSPRGGGSAWDAYEAGRALIGAKEATPRKRWLAALKQHTSIGPRSCQRYMLLARVVDAKMVDQPIRDMSFTEAYGHASTAAATLARRSSTPSAAADAVGEGTPATGASKEVQDKALLQFRQAAQGAAAAGIPYRRLQRAVAEAVGAKLVEKLSVEPAEASDAA
jgi:hypothetical protein